MMKKQLFLLLTLVVTSLAFVSCSDDDDDNQYNSAIVGTWKITEVKTSQSGSYMDWPFKPALFIGWHFHDNGNKISLAKYTCEPRQYHNCYE